MWYDGGYQRLARGGNAVRIAVVDDNAADRDWLAGQVEALLARRGLEGTVLPFPDGEGFLDAARR